MACMSGCALRPVLLRPSSFQTMQIIEPRLRDSLVLLHYLVLVLRVLCGASRGSTYNFPRATSVLCCACSFTHYNNYQPWLRRRAKSISLAT